MAKSTDADFLGNLQIGMIEEFSREYLEKLPNEKLAEYIRDGNVDNIVIRSKYGSKVWRASVIKIIASRSKKIISDNAMRQQKTKTIISEMKRKMDNYHKTVELFDAY